MNHLMRHCLYGTSKNANDCDMSVTMGIEMAKFSDGPRISFPAIFTGPLGTIVEAGAITWRND